MPRVAPLALLLLLLATAAAEAAACRWREPPRSYPDATRWSCEAIRWADGDTLTAVCAGRRTPVKIRLRGVDTVERGDPRWRASREELRRRTDGVRLVVLPHHMSRGRVVADVLAGAVNVGAAMDAAGWSKRGCPMR
jgi:endonuclease YncB( thermonuclease family)